MEWKSWDFYIKAHHFVNFPQTTHRKAQRKHKLLNYKNNKNFKNYKLYARNAKTTPKYPINLKSDASLICSKCFTAFLRTEFYFYTMLSGTHDQLRAKWWEINGRHFCLFSQWQWSNFEIFGACPSSTTLPCLIGKLKYVLPLRLHVLPEFLLVSQILTHFSRYSVSLLNLQY